MEQIWNKLKFRSKALKNAAQPWRRPLELAVRYGEHKQHCSKDASEFLQQGSQTLAKSREPGLHDGCTRHATIEWLQELLHDPQVFPPPSQLQLVPYGSFLSSCYSRSSDLDLALMGAVSEAVLGRWEGLSAGAPVPLERVTREECDLLLQRLANALESQQLTRGSVDRNPLEARVPITKYGFVKDAYLPAILSSNQRQWRVFFMPGSLGTIRSSSGQYIRPNFSSGISPLLMRPG
ncbi:hypothetical protein VaNZ11_009672 [Volvox africanus]|uniref:Poly(A) RNA polymerase mitochondrial-like central palm domain-containing protein n=1 Tax=Volvox africanus TaxID=51714 RepID=A0ABQ5S7T5_9CHLO|nr:hypothetical protein VaNZ11_009672 [Volvox africanus]